MTIIGAASNPHNTVQVTGGGQAPASTTHICLFRVNGLQIIFKASQPLSIANGDLVVVSGREKSNGFNAYAVRNTATGIIAHSGIVGKIILGLLMLVFGLLFCGIAAFVLGGLAALLYLAFLGFSIFQFYRAIQISLSLSEVKNYNI